MESMFEKAAAAQQPQGNQPSTPASTPAPAAGSMEQMFTQAAQQQQQQDGTAPTAPQTPGTYTMHAANPYQKDNGDGTVGGYFRAVGHNVETLYDRVEHMFTQPATVRALGENVGGGQRSDEGGNKIFAPEQGMTPEERKAHPGLTAIGEKVGEATSAGSVLLMALGGGLGQVANTATGALAARMVSAGFTLGALKSAYDRYPAIKQAWKDMDESELTRLMFHVVLDLGMAAATGQHTVVGEAPLGPGERAPETQYEKVQREVGEEDSADARAVGGPAPGEAPAAPKTANLNPYAPVAVEPRGTKRTVLRPTTVEHAGVSVPIPASQQEGGSLPAQVAEKFASPGAAKEFQRTQTAPAATEALVSSLGQGVEDKVNAHNALVDGETAPELISGTQTPSKHKTIDSMWQSTKATSERTYQHADDISQREQAEWEAARDKAIETHKAGIDQHNSVVDQYNEALSEGEEPMEKVAFNPDDVRGIPERPKSYNELKSELDTANAAGSSSNPDAVTRGEARKVGIPKAEKNLDKWFQDHKDEISPAEYQSAKRLRAESEIYQTMAKRLRAAMDEGSVTQKSLIKLEAAVNNKAIDRGQAPGQFRRLLGEDGYTNWRNVSKLFAPVNGGPGIGAYVLELAASHLIPFGVAGKLATEALLNKVLFDSTFGGWFTRAADSVMKTGSLSSQLKDTLTGLWKNDRGEAGAPGTIPLTAADEARAAGPSMEEQFAKAAGEAKPAETEQTPEEAYGAAIAGEQPAPAPAQPAPEPARPPVDQKEYGNKEISTRWSKKMKGVANDKNAMPNMDAMNMAEANTPGFFSRIVDAMRGYSEANGLPIEETEGMAPKDRVEAIINHMKDNLVWLHNRLPENFRNVAKQWYDTAHVMTKDMAEQYGITHEKMAAVVAALSPKNGWDNNVGMAERLVKIWTSAQDHPWDDKMEASLNKITANPKLKPAYRAALNSIRGKQYTELTGKTNNAALARKGLWVRIFDEAHNSRQTPTYSPDGKIVGHQTLTWGMPDPMAKAIGILEGDGSIDHINSMMGEKNKIRSFYNNIINPDSPLGHVTIDTHAVNINLLKALGSDSEEVLHNFGGAPGHAGTGLSGTYAVHAEAYRRAAAELGLKPRELQSITWEGIRRVFGEEKKTAELKSKIAEIWQQYQGRKEDTGVQSSRGFESRPKSGIAPKSMTLDQARNAIWDAAGGMKSAKELREETAQKATPDTSENAIQQMVSLGEGQHKLTSDVNPPGLTPDIMKWKGQPQPTVGRKPNGRPDYSNLQDIADHGNANVTPEEILSGTSHEVAHALLQHELGVPTDNLSIGLGHTVIRRGRLVPGTKAKASMDGISGGNLNPGEGSWQARYEADKGNPETLKNFLRDYTTQLMGGRAVEEMTGIPQHEINGHIIADVQMAKGMLRNHGVPSYIHDALLNDATTRAKAILHDKYDTLQHLTNQMVNHYGGDRVDSETFHKYRKGGVFEKK